MFQNKEHVSKIVAASLGFAQEMLWEAVPFKIHFWNMLQKNANRETLHFGFLAITVKALKKTYFGVESSTSRIFCISARVEKGFCRNALLPEKTPRCSTASSE